jgi:hypothetical protein
MARVTAENLGQISTVLICGDNAETGLRASVDGHFDDSGGMCAEFANARVVISESC